MKTNLLFKQIKLKFFKMAKNKKQKFKTVSDIPILELGQRHHRNGIPCWFVARRSMAMHRVELHHRLQHDFGRLLKYHIGRYRHHHRLHHHHRRRRYHHYMFHRFFDSFPSHTCCFRNNFSRMDMRCSCQCSHICHRFFHNF